MIAAQATGLRIVDRLGHGAFERHMERLAAEVVVAEGFREVVRVGRRFDAQRERARELVAAFVEREARLRPRGSRISV